MVNPTIIEIDNFLISSSIFTEKFFCDIPRCRGACCIIGDSGAPLEDGERTLIEKEYSKISKYLRPEGIRTIEEQGISVRDLDDDLVTPLIGGEECAYTLFDKDDNCFCAIEFAHNEGESTLRKPISCWLYPIRVSTLSNGMVALNLHEWHVCIDAYAKGRRDGIPVYRFLKNPLIHAFGEEFYEKLSICAAQNF
ncbi:MAG: DUF3109 family protein [Bacteroidales bacterium]|jgi:hypothetical protein|nr:DUF3109 family protein [Bacteroidales bacterium]